MGGGEISLKTQVEIQKVLKKRGNAQCVQSFLAMFKKVLKTGEMFNMLNMFNMFNFWGEPSMLNPCSKFPPQIEHIEHIEHSPVLSTFLNMAKKD